MSKINVKYKDRLFNFLFGSEENKAWTLSLYNAMNGTHYENPDDMELNTIKEVLYMGMHNDVSFLIFGEQNLYEHQSTFNPNMPLREMQYIGNLYEKYIEKNELNKYSSEVIVLPVPKLLVFYNGTDKEPDEQILKLSDAFPEEKRADADIEVRVRMLNINHGHNKKLMEACKPLSEYAKLIEDIRRKMGRKESMENAIDHAIDEMPEDSVILPFLRIHRMEVKGMLLTEYDEAKTMERIRREAGLNVLFQLVEKGVLSIEIAAEQAGMSEKQFRDVMLQQYKPSLNETKLPEK